MAGTVLRREAETGPGVLAGGSLRVPIRRRLKRLRAVREVEHLERIGTLIFRQEFLPRPFELLFARVASALAPPGQAPWSHAFGLLLTAWDGTTLKIAASKENAAWAGPGGTGQGGHYPRARLVALACCGTRGLLGAAAGPVRTGEGALPPLPNGRG